MSYGNREQTCSIEMLQSCGYKDSNILALDSDWLGLGLVYTPQAFMECRETSREPPQCVQKSAEIRTSSAESEIRTSSSASLGISSCVRDTRGKLSDNSSDAILISSFPNNANRKPHPVHCNSCVLTETSESDPLSHTTPRPLPFTMDGFPDPAPSSPHEQTLGDSPKITPLSKCASSSPSSSTSSPSLSATDGSPGRETTAFPTANVTPASALRKAGRDQAASPPRKRHHEQVSNEQTLPALPPCRVCLDTASGFHYGANTCQGCKGFFRRALQTHSTFKCIADGHCDVTGINRKLCAFCRYKKCLAVGMSRTAIKIGRYTSETRMKNIMEAKLAKQQGLTAVVRRRNSRKKPETSTAASNDSNCADTASPVEDDTDRASQEYSTKENGDRDWQNTCTVSGLVHPDLSCESSVAQDDRDAFGANQNSPSTPEGEQFSMIESPNTSTSDQMGLDQTHTELEQFLARITSLHGTFPVIPLTGQVAFHENSSGHQDTLFQDVVTFQDSPVSTYSFSQTNPLPRDPKTVTNMSPAISTCQTDSTIITTEPAGSWSNTPTAPFCTTIPCSFDQVPDVPPFDQENASYPQLNSVDLSETSSQSSMMQSEELEHLVLNTPDLEGTDHPLDFQQITETYKQCSVNYNSWSDYQVPCEDIATDCFGKNTGLGPKEGCKSTDSDQAGSSQFPTNSFQPAASPTLTLVACPPTTPLTNNTRNKTANAVSQNAVHETASSPLSSLKSSSSLSSLFPLPVPFSSSSSSSSLLLLPSPSQSSLSWVSSLLLESDEDRVSEIEKSLEEVLKVPLAFVDDVKMKQHLDLLEKFQVLNAAKFEAVVRPIHGANNSDFDHIIHRLVVSHNKKILVSTYFPDRFIRRKQISFLENYRFREELFGEVKIIPADDYLKLYRKTGMDVDGRLPRIKTHIYCVEWFLRRLISWAKGIPGFKDLDLNDRVLMLKKARSCILFLGAFKGFNSDLDIVVFPNGRCLHRKETQYIFPDLWADIGFSTAKDLNREIWRPEELVLLKALLFTMVDKSKLRKPEAVDKIQNLLLACLRHSFRRRYPHEDPLGLVGQALTKLNLVRPVSCLSSIMGENKIIQEFYTEHPLLRELFGKDP